MTELLLKPLRLATLADLPAITDFVQLSYAHWVPVIGREPQPMTVDYAQALAAHRFDLLEAGGRLVALAETSLQHDHLRVVNVAVHPEHQGQGLGRRLLDHAEALARAVRAPALRLATNAEMARNIRLYQMAGYRIERREPLEVGFGVHMLKVIDPAERRLLFLPGAGASPTFWRPLGDRLPKRWIKTWLGWPGLGDERPSPEVSGWEDLVAMTELALGDDGPPVDLLAQSMGGYVALAAMLRRPDRVRRLVLSVTSGGVDVAGMGGAPWRETYRQEHPQAPTWLYDPVPDLTEHLRGLTKPVLLLWGGADPISPPAVGRRLAELMPNAALHIVPGADHDVVQSHAGILAPMVAEFLG